MMTFVENSVDFYNYGFGKMGLLTVIKLWRDPPLTCLTPIQARFGDESIFVGTHTGVAEWEIAEQDSGIFHRSG